MATKTSKLTIDDIYSSYPNAGWSGAFDGIVLAGNINIQNADGSYTKQNCRTKLKFTVDSTLKVGTCTSLKFYFQLKGTSAPKSMKACLATNNVTKVGDVLNSSGSAIDTNNVTVLAYSDTYTNSNCTTRPTGSMKSGDTVYFKFDLSGKEPLVPGTSYYIYVYRTVTNLETPASIYGAGAYTAGQDTNKTNYTLTLEYAPHFVRVYNGIGYSSNAYSHGQQLDIKADTKEGYIFTNWSGDSTSTSKSITVIVDGDKEYTANYRPYTLTVTYHGNGATSGTFNGTTISIPSQKLRNPTDADNKYIESVFKYDLQNDYGLYNIQNSTLDLRKTGYHVTDDEEWGTTVNGDGLKIDHNLTGLGQKLAEALGKPIKESDQTVTVYAQWVANTYTISYNSNGGTGGSTANTSCTYDSNVTIRSNGFERLGYKFVGWNTAADGSGTAYTENQSVTNLTTANGETITLYAQWEALATMFVKVDSKYIAGIPYIKVDGGWKRAIGVYVKVDGKWKLSTR